MRRNPEARIKIIPAVLNKAADDRIPPVKTITPYTIMSKPPRPTIDLSSWPVISSLLFIFAICIYLILGPAVKNLRDSFGVGSWPTVEGMVEQAHDKGNTRANRILNQQYRFLYRYEVDGQEYTGQRYSLQYPTGSRGEGVAQFHVGEPCKVTHHPTRPVRSVIETSAPVWWNYVIVGLHLFGGFLVIQAGVINPRVNRRRAGQSDD